MSNVIMSSGKNPRQENPSNDIKLDFETWLTSLRSGNLVEAKRAFKALKRDFEISTEVPTRPESRIHARLTCGKSSGWDEKQETQIADPGNEVD